MSDPPVDRVEAALAADDDRLAAELPDVLAAVDGQVPALVEERPELFGRVVVRTEATDVAGFVADNPELADEFQAFLWTGVETLAENSPAVRGEATTDVTVNFAATDCEMTGHLVVDGDANAVTGGAGHIEDPTLRIEGPADVLVGLVTGDVDPVGGFMGGEFEMDGPVGKGTRLASVMNALSAELPDDAGS